MLKRFSISFFLLLAFALLQAHGFIPHQHLETKTAHHHHHDGQQHSHHSDNDHDQDNKPEEDHGAPFHVPGHSAELGKIVAKPKESVEINAGCSNMVAELPALFAYLFTPQSSPPKLRRSHDQAHIDQYSPHCVSLRGPPVFIVA
jgi:hypothetical protein